MTPVSVDDTFNQMSLVRETMCNTPTLIVALMLWNPCGAIVYTDGRSTIFRSPNVAKSRQRFCIVFAVWLTNNTSEGKMSSPNEYELHSARLTQQNIESVHFDIRLGINGVGKA